MQINKNGRVHITNEEFKTIAFCLFGSNKMDAIRLDSQDSKKRRGKKDIVQYGHEDFVRAKHGLAPRILYSKEEVYNILTEDLSNTIVKKTPDESTI